MMKKFPWALGLSKAIPAETPPEHICKHLCISKLPCKGRGHGHTIPLRAAGSQVGDKGALYCSQTCPIIYYNTLSYVLSAGCSAGTSPFHLIEVF